MMEKFSLKSPNGILLMLVLGMQSIAFLIFMLGDRYEGNIRLEYRVFGVLIYLFTYLHFSAVKKYLIINILWTVGFFIVFQNSIVSVSGALLMCASVWWYQKEKLIP